MSHHIATLPVLRYLVCSSGEEVELAEDDTDFDAAVALLERKRAEEVNDETWSLVAEIDA